jgi:dethiobiotin synthetase
MRGVFVSGTGTGVGKTVISTGLVRCLRRRGLAAIGVKPIETGCSPLPLDALALADASELSALASDPIWYRASPPLAPYAVSLLTSQAGPDLAAISARVSELGAMHECVVVEGAGGLHVPLDASRSMLNLIEALAQPILLVAEDSLGVLSHVLSAAELLEHRGLQLCGVVLNRHSAGLTDESCSTNAWILRERLGVPVLVVPALDAVDLEQQASAIEAAGVAHAAFGLDLAAGGL